MVENINYLKGNNFSGVLPPEIVELTNMEWMYLSSNQFMGNIPEGFGKMTKLKYLNLSILAHLNMFF